MQLSSTLLLKTTPFRRFYIISDMPYESMSFSTIFFTILRCVILHIVFVFLSLSLWLLCAETGSVAIHQVRTVTEAAERAWRGTGKIIHPCIHLLARLISPPLIIVTPSLLSLEG